MGPPGDPGDVDYERIIEEVIARIPPPIIQPTYISQDGQSLPYKDPILLPFGEVTPIDPIKLRVYGANDEMRTNTQAPIGGTMELKLGRFR
jgi:hypothetical protein